jgi:YVTN family beta-propeller protein
LRIALSLLLTAALETSAAAAPFAYVLVQRDDDPGPGSTGGQTLVVIDTATNGVVTSIPLGLSCYFCFKASTLAVAADGSRVFVANQVAGTVSIVDVATHTVAGSVSVGGAPNGVVPSPDGTTLYVLRGTSIAVIDVATLAVSRAITLPTPPTATYGMAITPDGAQLYVGDFGRSRLFVVDTASGSAGIVRWTSTSRLTGARCTWLPTNPTGCSWWTRPPMRSPQS